MSVLGPDGRYTYVYMYASADTCMCMRVCMRICMCMRVCMRMCMCMHVCMRIGSRRFVYSLLPPSFSLFLSRSLSLALSRSLSLSLSPPLARSPPLSTNGQSAMCILSSLSRSLILSLPLCLFFFRPLSLCRWAVGNTYSLLHLECHSLVFSNLNLNGFFPTESGKRDVENKIID